MKNRASFAHYIGKLMRCTIPEGAYEYHDRATNKPVGFKSNEVCLVVDVEEHCTKAKDVIGVHMMHQGRLVVFTMTYACLSRDWEEA